jgi:hypothetical protein
MKVKFVCINLEKDIARRQFMSNQLGDQVTFFPAIDAEYLEIRGSKLYYKGKLLNVNYDKDEYLYETALGFGRRHYRNLGIPYAQVDAKIDGNIVSIIHDDTTFYTDITPYKKNLSKTELACALSHYFVQKELSASTSDAYLVLEDDVLVDTDKLATILQHLEHYYPLVDLLFLNHPQFITPDSLIDYTELMNLGVFSGYSGAYSYILTKHGSCKLMDAYASTIGSTADDFLSQQIQLHQTRVKTAVCTLNNQFESTIKTSLTI